MKVSVIVCTIGREELEKCLNSLKGQSYEDFELILVSNEEISDRLIPDVDFNFVKTDDKNISEQRNRGVEESEGEIIAFLDDDAVPDDRWLEELIKPYEDKDVMCVGGRAIPDYQKEPEGEVKNLDEHILRGLIGATFIDSDEPVEIVSPLIWGCNMSSKREVFEEISKFPEGLGRRGNLLSGEERYLQFKILESNYKIVYNPEAKVKHRISEEQVTPQYLIKRSFWQGISEVKRLEIENSLKPIRENKEIIKNIIPTKINMKLFDLYSSKKLKEKIDQARKIGRLTGIGNIIS